LGVLYVVDSVTRQWVDQARKIGQLPGSGAPDGTFAAGVTRVTELLPVLMNDIINSAPEDQKVSLATYPGRERHSTLGGDVAFTFRKPRSLMLWNCYGAFPFLSCIFV
jgi:hypothetical protein